MKTVGGSMHDEIAKTLATMFGPRHTQLFVIKLHVTLKCFSQI